MSLQVTAALLRLFAGYTAELYIRVIDFAWIESSLKLAAGFAVNP